jgi:hypothetical protein
MSEAKDTAVLFTTVPQGVHEVRLLGDAIKPGDRIYEVRDQHEEKSRIRIFGSELASLLQWWTTEKDRPGTDEEDE